MKENYSNFALDWAQSIKLLKWSSKHLNVMVAGRRGVKMIILYLKGHRLDPHNSRFVLINNVLLVNAVEVS